MPSNRGLGIKAKKCRYEGVIVPTALYGRMWTEVNVLLMNCLRSLLGVSQMDRVRNEEQHRRAGIASREDQRVLRWFGHAERMDEYAMARRVLVAEVSGGLVRGRPSLGWIDGVKVALGNRGIAVETASQCAKDGKEWRALVHL